jgi:hypothetical protein
MKTALTNYTRSNFPPILEAETALISQVSLFRGRFFRGRNFSLEERNALLVSGRYPNGPEKQLYVLGVRLDSGLTRGFVVAGGSAGFAVHDSILADAHVNTRLAHAAVFFALTLIFLQFALQATVFGGFGSGGHGNNVAPP